MTLLAYLHGDDEAHQIRLGGLGLTTNSDGSVGAGEITFDDPDGTLEVRGWMEVVVIEDACVDAPILFKGWIGDRTYKRSNGEVTYRDGPGRFIDCNILDPNEALGIRLITNPDGKRPAETHIQRIDWLLGSGYLSGLVSDLGLVDRSDPRPFGPADYRDQYPLDVLNDIAAPIFRTFYVYASQPDGDFGLFFDIPTSTVNTSPLAISNVIADKDDQTFYPFIDAELHRDPSQTRAKTRYRFTRGEIIENNDTTYATFFSPTATGGLNLGYRGFFVSNDRVSSEATARHMADNLNTKYSVEEDTISVTIEVPPEVVGFLDVGQRVPVTFTHFDLEGYGDAQYVRVTSRTIAQGITNLSYLVTLELNNTGVVGSGGGGSTGPGDFPHPPPTTPGLEQVVTQVVSGVASDRYVHMNTPPGEGNMLVVWQMSRGVTFGGSGPVAGWTIHSHGQIHPGADYARMMYRVAGAGESIDVEVLNGSEPGGYQTVYEISGVGTAPDAQSFDDVTTGTMPSSVDAGTLAPTAGLPAFAVMGLAVHCSDAVGTQVTFLAAGAAWTQDAQGPWTGAHPLNFAAHQSINPTTGTYATTTGLSGFPTNFGGWGGEAMLFTGSAETNPPSPGQGVPWEVVTMTTENGVSVGTTSFPYATGSLLVKVDGVLISHASYTETDPQCGDFALTWKVDADEVVTVQYQGNPGS